MAEHWCKEHQTVYFKKGTMKGYAHPIVDDDGENTGEWCNEPQEKESEKPKSQRRDSATNDSIELQVAIKSTPDLVRLKAEFPHDRLANASYQWAVDKTANWSSMGEVEPQSETKPSPVTDKGKGIPSPKPATPEQRKRLSAVIKKWDVQKAKDLLVEQWQINETKHLNREQMEDFITQLEKGIKEPKIDPENIPF